MFICMRTTLNLSDELLKAAKRRAVERGITLTAFFEEALAAALAPRADAERAYRLDWKSHAGRLVAGVNIADRDALYDAMEQNR
jgi:hypothetical protein